MADWKNAKADDFVTMHDGVKGKVVANFELGLYSDGYSPEGWKPEKGGLLLEAEFGGLVRYIRDVLP